MNEEELEEAEELIRIWDNFRVEQDTERFCSAAMVSLKLAVEEVRRTRPSVDKQGFCKTCGNSGVHIPDHIPKDTGVPTMEPCPRCYRPTEEVQEDDGPCDCSSDWE